MPEKSEVFSASDCSQLRTEQHRFSSGAKISIIALVDRRIPGFWGFQKHGFNIQAVKAWREQEHDAGRPSGLEDFSRAHGLCSKCHANGNLVSGVRWVDATGLEVIASLGTDEQPISISQLVRIHNLNSFRWDYLYEPCPACHGTGKLPPMTRH